MIGHLCRWCGNYTQEDKWRQGMDYFCSEECYNRAKVKTDLSEEEIRQDRIRANRDMKKLRKLAGKSPTDYAEMQRKETLERMKHG